MSGASSRQAWRWGGVAGRPADVRLTQPRDGVETVSVVGSPRSAVSCGLLAVRLAAAEWRGSKAGPQQAGEDGRLRRPAASSAHVGIRRVISRFQVHKNGRSFWPAVQAGKRQIRGEDDRGSEGVSVERFA
jgi:hypothetical protein